MSILRFFNGRNRDISRLKERLEYITDPEKMTGNYSGVAGVLPTAAFQDMKIIKILHGKMTGRQYIHFVVSFDSVVTPLTADKICDEILDMFRGKYQAVYAIHENTENVHGHFIINSVGVDGGKFRQSKSEMLQFRAKINDVLQKYDLNEIGKIDISDEDEVEEFIYEAQWDELEGDDDYFPEYLDEYSEDDLSLSENHESSAGNKEGSWDINIPMWFGERKPYLPIWFEPYEPIKFFDEKQQEKECPIWFTDEEEVDDENFF